MVFEDFTTYTEVEPDDRIQKTAQHIDHLAYRNEDSYLYKDKDVDHFGSNWEHLVDVYCASSNAQGIGAFWAVTNDLDDIQGLYNADKNYLYMCFAAAGTVTYLVEGYGGVHYADSYASSVATWYYLRIKKVGTAFTCKIYDTAASRDAETADAHLLDTLSLTLHSDLSYRYIFGCNSQNTGETIALAQDIENLDLQEAVVALDFSASIITITKTLGITNLTIPKFKPLLPKFNPRMII